MKPSFPIPSTGQRPSSSEPTQNNHEVSKKVISLLSPPHSPSPASRNNRTLSESLPAKSSTTFPRSITKDDAVVAVKKILVKEECRFELHTFASLRDKNLKSKVYEHYTLLCHANTKSSAGWAICKYVESGSCRLENGCQKFDSINGTTNMLRHVKAHEKRTGQTRLIRDIGNKAKKEIAKAAALVVSEDLRPYSFAEGEGMKAFIFTIFQIGQSVPAGDHVNPQALVTSARTVHDTLTELCAGERRRFKETVGGLLQIGGGMSVDGVTIQNQEKHFYDLTLHYFDFDSDDVFRSQNPAITCRTILLAEAESGNTAFDIKHMLNTNLLEKYQIDLEKLTRTFTLVTDWAAVMPNIVGASISPNVAPIDDTWMGCIAHQLNTAMKFCFSLCEKNDDFLGRIITDLGHVKTLVRIFKQSKWNHELGDGYRLIQEVETRFSTTYHVAARLTKSGASAFSVVDRKGSAAAKNAKAGILQHTDPNNHVVTFPAIEAIVDACDIIAFTQKVLEGSNSPTIHLVLPMLHKCDMVLKRFELGEPVDRGFSRGQVRPHDYSVQFCGLMRRSLRENVVVHDLWLAACIMHPLLRGLEGCTEPSQRLSFKARGENMVRKLYLDFGGTQGEPVGCTESINTNDTAPFVTNTGSAVTDGHTSKKRKFDLFEFADSTLERTAMMRKDEVTKYLELDISTFNINKQLFSRDDFGAIKFWRDRRCQFPVLYKVARKLFATPVSSCSSERVFSAVNRIVTDDRTNMTSESLEDIVLLRSANRNK